MGKTNDLHPLGFSVPPHRFSRLQQVLDLRQRSVRVALVDQLVQFLNGIPHREPAAVLVPRPECDTRFEVECDRLLRVLLLISA